MTRTERDRLADALLSCFISPNVVDYNFEAANVVDVLARIADAINNVAKALRDHGKVEQ